MSNVTFLQKELSDTNKLDFNYVDVESGDAIEFSDKKINVAVDGTSIKVVNGKLQATSTPASAIIGSGAVKVNDNVVSLTIDGNDFTQSDNKLKLVDKGYVKSVVSTGPITATTASGVVTVGLQTGSGLNQSGSGLTLDSDVVRGLSVTVNGVTNTAAISNNQASVDLGTIGGGSTLLAGDSIDISSGKVNLKYDTNVFTLGSNNTLNIKDGVIPAAVIPGKGLDSSFNVKVGHGLDFDGDDKIEIPLDSDSGLDIVESSGVYKLRVAPEDFVDGTTITVESNKIKANLDSKQDKLVNGVNIASLNGIGLVGKDYIGVKPLGASIASGGVGLLFDKDEPEDDKYVHLKTISNQSILGDGDINAVTGVGVNNIKKLTQAEYDALTTKDASTLYVIVG